MRTSSYTIYADLPDRNDVLLIHGYTGAHDVVSRDVANFLRANETVKPVKPLYGAWSPEPVGPHDTPDGEIVERLRKRGYITEKSPDEEAQLLDRLVNAMQARNLMPGYIVMTTYDCNLRCHYCFQDHMRTDPAYAHLLKTITPELTNRILAALPAIEARHQVPADALHRSFLFFGGEPLLAAARPAIENFMNRARELSPVRFTAITNATELDAYGGLIGPGGIEWLQITVDGPPEEHDRRRIRTDGSGSWDAIARNITFVLDQGATVSVRMNIDRTNIGQLERLAEEMDRQGWFAHPRFSANVAAVHAGNGKTEKSTTFDSYQLAAELRRRREERPLLGRFAVPVDGLKAKISSVLNGTVDPRAYQRASFCGAHTSSYVFDPLGDIYACWERTGDVRVRIGYLGPDGAVFPRTDKSQPAPTGRKLLPIASAEPIGIDAWRSRTVSTNSACRKCRYALQCGGGCAAQALEHKDKYLTNYCDGFQNTFRVAAAEAFLARESGEQIAALDSPCGI